jgi:hypothetical protein
VDVPPKKVPYFKPGKELKELINQEPAAAPLAPAGGVASPPVTAATDPDVVGV